MAAASNSRSVRIVPLLIVVCLVGIPVHPSQQRCCGEWTQAKYGSSGVAASAETSTYVFVPDQSKVVQTGGIAGVPRTYSIKGEFQLTIDPNAGSASFAHVDANATDDSQFKRTLDLNHVFNMTSLVGTVEPTGSIKFTGKASDDSDVGITVTLQDGLAHLIGQTTPPPNSADFFIFSLDAVAQLRKYSGGSGTAEDPYQIATADDLIALGETPEDYDKHFILTADIDLDPNLPDGKVFDKAVIAADTDPAGWYQGPVFSGTFDGRGHRIMNMTVSGNGFLGLFGRLASRAVVSDVGLEDVEIIGTGDRVGGLVGLNHGTVTNSYSTGVVTGQGSGIGGLVGATSEGTVTDSHSTSTVDGRLWVGGLVGDNWGPVSGCYSTGSVHGDASVGGLVGYNDESAITNSYSTGSVSGRSQVGGLAGLTRVGDDEHGGVFNSYSAGSVSGVEMVGGLVGDIQGGMIFNSYSAGEVGGDRSVGGLAGRSSDADVVASFWDSEASHKTTSAGGTGKTTAEMQTAGAFLDAGWDFVNVWGIGENQTYPYLRKYSAADINQDASVNFLDLAVLAENWLTDISHR